MLEPHEWKGGTSPLGLAGWEVLKVEQGELQDGGPLRTYHVIRTAGDVRSPKRCSRISCSEASFTLDGRERFPFTRKRWTGRAEQPDDSTDRRPQGVSIVDVPAYGGAVHWRIYRTRLVCAACGARTFEALPAYIDIPSGMTARCHRYVRHQATIRPFLNVAKEIGCRDAVVGRIAKGAHDPELRTVPNRYLGIDEINLFDRGNPNLAHVAANRTTFVDLESGNVLGILQSDALSAVTGWIGELSEAERDRIRAVAIDMNLGYRPAVRAALPKALIVVDRYHVEARAQTAADKVRLDEVKDDAVRGLMKGVGGLHRDHLKVLARMLRSTRLPRSVERRKMLRDYLRAHPRTWAAVQARQNFGLIYDTAKDQEEAERRFAAWRTELDPTVRGAFAAVESALDLFPREILNFFAVRITNGPTESANSAMRRMVRAGPSIHIETLRAKVLARTRLRPTRSFFCDACRERSPVDPEHHVDLTGDLVCEECRAAVEGRKPRPDKMRPRGRRPSVRLTLRDLFAMEEDDLRPRRPSRRKAGVGRGVQLALPLRNAIASATRLPDPGELRLSRRRSGAAAKIFDPVRQVG